MANVYMGADVEEFIFGEGTTYEESSKKEEKDDKNDNKDSVEEGAEEFVEEEVEVTDEEINTCGVIECVDDPEVACYRIALENEQNYNRIMNAFMTKEYSVLESTGEEMVYEAADIKTFFDAVKKQISVWWSKIQGVVKNLMDKIAARVDMNMKFVNKYKNADIKTPEKSKEFKGYNFDNTRTPNYAVVAGLVALAVDKKKIAMVRKEEDADAIVNKFKEDFGHVKDQMRAVACGYSQGKTVSEDSYAKELQLALFGSEEKVNVSLKPFATLLNDLEYAKVLKAAAKNAHKKAQDSVKTLMKEVKMAESDLKKADRKNHGMKIAKCMTDSVNASLGIMSKAFHMEAKAINAKAHQDMAMAMFYITNQPKKEKSVKSESVELENNGLDIVII